MGLWLGLEWDELVLWVDKIIYFYNMFIVYIVLMFGWVVLDVSYMVIIMGV